MQVLTANPMARCFFPTPSGSKRRAFSFLSMKGISANLSISSSSIDG